MGQRRNRLPGITLYVLAGLLMLYTVWSVIDSYLYLAAMIAQGQLTVSGNVYDIVNFFMTNGVQYGLFAVILFALGWMLQNNSMMTSGEFDTVRASLAAETSGDESDEDDFEDWFRKTDSHDG